MNRFCLGLVSLFLATTASARVACDLAVDAQRQLKLSCGGEVIATLHGDALSKELQVGREVIFRANPIGESKGQVDIFVWTWATLPTEQIDDDQYFNLIGYRQEVDPGKTDYELMPGYGYGFWGSVKKSDCDIAFTVRQLRGFDRLEHPIVLNFSRANCSRAK